MQDLRDKLLKAGLATKKEARKARTESRQRQKQEGARAQKRAEQQRQQAFESKQAEERAEQQRQQQARNEARAAAEREHQLQNIIQQHTRLKIHGWDQLHYFLRRNGTIGRIRTTFAIAAELASGDLAIVEQRDEPGHAVVEARAVVRLEEMGAAQRILFWNKPGDARDDGSPTYGGTR